MEIIVFSIIATFLLTLVNGYFSMSEMALTTAKRANLEHDAENGDKRAARALKIAADSANFLATIQVAITFVGFFSAMVSSTTLSDPLSSWMQSFGIEPLSAVAPVISPIIITVVVSYLSIVIGELVPKRIGLTNAEGMAKSVAGPLSVFSKVARPLVWLTGASANGISALLGIKSADDRQNVSEEEIKYMVSEQEGMRDEEKRMIHEVFELGDAKAREVMVPRVDTTMVEDTSTVAEVMSLMRRTGYSRIPVFHEDPDRVVGIAHIKDLLAPMLAEHGSEDLVRDHVRDATFVPDSKDVLPLLSEMRAAHDQMVIVVDEYGGTAGLITMEDIVEEVVGEIEDEFDPDNKYLTRLTEREWLVDGRFSCDDAEDLGWPIEESDEYETIAGWLLELSDAVPHIGDIFEQDGYRFKVQSMRGQRISLIRVVAPEPQAEGEDAGAGADEKDRARNDERRRALTEQRERAHNDRA